MAIFDETKMNHRDAVDQRRRRDSPKTAIQGFELTLELHYRPGFDVMCSQLHAEELLDLLANVSDGSRESDDRMEIAEEFLRAFRQWLGVAETTRLRTKCRLIGYRAPSLYEETTEVD